MFSRVLIANRGAVARRVIRACHDLGVEVGCVHSDIDATTPAVAEADFAARLPGYKVVDTYLNIDKILDVAREHKVDAIHPGYGFLAESEEFARAVGDAGMNFIGPSISWMEVMSEKTQARATMASKGMPVHPGSEVIETKEDLAAAVKTVGLPMMLKPAAGGGGIGMIVIRSEDKLWSVFERSRELASRTFGDGRLYAEKYLDKPRHIEFQILGDGAESICIGERDCSVQRRHQKLIEEAPVPYVDNELLGRTRDQILGAVDTYDSVGTVECLYANSEFGFLEMNTRLQVEHGVTEESAGVDLVTAQIRLAAGDSLDSLDLKPRSPLLYAVEARLYAEDPKTLLPSTGFLQVFEPPQMEGVRIESTYAEGNVVSPYYDPLLAKVIGVGETREQAIARTTIALKAFNVEGVNTNSQLLQTALGIEAFILGGMHTELVADLL